MADSNHVRKLMEGVAAWNQWRSENSDVSVDLTQADLRDIELPGAMLRNADLSGCDLRGAILDNANLSLATLIGSNLIGARLHAASLRQAIVSRARLNDVDASAANFGEADLRHCTFEGAKLVGANFSMAICKDSQFVGADLNRSDLARTDFRDSNLIRANFAEASLEGADLRRCSLISASFNSAKLSNANLRRAKLDDADLAGAKLTHANLREVTGLNCDQLTQAQDWAAAYRDVALACDAAIPDPDVMRGNTSDSVSPAETRPPIIELFGAGLSRWRDDITESERHAQLERSRQALLELEKALIDLRGRPERGLMGHNMPPEAMIPDEVFDQYVAEVRAGIALHDAPRPDKPRLSRLRDVLDRFRQWLQPRVNIATDSAAKAFGVAVGAGSAALLAKLSGAWEQLGALINMLI